MPDTRLVSELTVQELRDIIRDECQRFEERRQAQARAKAEELLEIVGDRHDRR